MDLLRQVVNLLRERRRTGETTSLSGRSGCIPVSRSATCRHEARVVLPVLDVDRAKAFYQAIGFREDLDYASGEDFRVVQFTPPGSAASIGFGARITDRPPHPSTAVLMRRVVGS